jgi:CheY-like chemotaxis protein
MLGTVLVVEDNDLVRESFCHLLRQRGYDVVEAEDGQIALDRLREDNFDVAIVDIMMPSIGGLELREVLLAQDPPVPTILVTGQPDLVADLMGDNFDFLGGKITVLQKPVHPVKLLAEVEKCLNGQG